MWAACNSGVGWATRPPQHAALCPCSHVRAMRWAGLIDGAVPSEPTPSTVPLLRGTTTARCSLLSAHAHPHRSKQRGGPVSLMVLCGTSHPPHAILLCSGHSFNNTAAAHCSMPIFTSTAMCLTELAGPLKAYTCGLYSYGLCPKAYVVMAYTVMASVRRPM